MLRRNNLAVGWTILPGAFICLAAVLLFAGTTVRAETASVAEMEQVCRNWLTKAVFDRGVWAGSPDPEISGVHEIMSGDTVLARYYDISPRGYVLVPVLKEMQPVKAYSEEYTLDDLQAGGFLEMITEMLSQRAGLYARVYGSLEASQPAAGEAVFGRGQRESWDVLTKSDESFRTDYLSAKRLPVAEAGPLLTSSWHQRSPYNDLCPMGDGGRCVVGCVATATSQILHYWEWPPAGYGSHSYIWSGDQSCLGDVGGGELSADFSDEYDWANMPDSCDEGCTPAEEAALAELNSEVGIAMDMDYGACGSGASVSYAATTYVNYFKYKTSIQLENRSDYDLAGWFSIIQGEIDNGRPIQYRINKHSIVCDGWRDGGGQYEYHMNYGWGGPYTTWFVLDSLYCYWILPDSVCPADEEFMVTHIEPQTEPVLNLIGRTSLDADGHAEPGETVEMSMTIENLGWDAVDVSGKLSTSDPNIDFTVDSVAFDASIPWGGQGGSLEPFVFTVDAECPDPSVIIFELTMYASGGYSTVDTILMYAGTVAGFSDDMESGPGLWTHRPLTITYKDQWHLEDSNFYSPDYSWKMGGEGVDNYTDMCDAGLITPPFLLGIDPVLSFWHYIDAEEGGDPGTAWDGGIVMISSGDGVWTQLTPEGDYPFAIIDNPASPFDPGTPCYSDSVDWTEAIFDLSEYSGAVQIMFRFGSDGAATEEGWYIDDVVVSGVSYVCGDANGDGIVNVGDAVFLINYIFKDGITPYPIQAGDANGDGVVNVGDAVYTINYVFKDGAVPICP